MGFPHLKISIFPCRGGTYGDDPVQVFDLSGISPSSATRRALTVGVAGAKSRGGVACEETVSIFRKLQCEEVKRIFLFDPHRRRLSIIAQVYSLSARCCELRVTRNCRVSPSSRRTSFSTKTIPISSRTSRPSPTSSCSECGGTCQRWVSFPPKSVRITARCRLWIGVWTTSATPRRGTSTITS